MSFGVSPSDIWNLITVVNETYSRWKRACGEYASITSLPRGAETVLRQLHELVSHNQSWRRSEEQQLRDLLQDCGQTTEDLAKIIRRYRSLGLGRSRTWDRIKFGSKKDDLTQLERRLNSHISTLGTFLAARNATSLDAQGQDISSLLRHVQDLWSRAEADIDDAASVRTQWTSREGDSLDDWRGLRRELLRSGFDSSVISRQKSRILDLLRSLANDDDRGSSEELCAVQDEYSISSRHSKAREAHSRAQVEELSQSAAPGGRDTQQSPQRQQEPLQSDLILQVEAPPFPGKGLEAIDSALRSTVLYLTPCTHGSWQLFYFNEPEPLFGDKWTKDALLGHSATKHDFIIEPGALKNIARLAQVQHHLHPKRGGQYQEVRRSSGLGSLPLRSRTLSQLNGWTSFTFAFRTQASRLSRGAQVRLCVSHHPTILLIAWNLCDYVLPDDLVVCIRCVLRHTLLAIYDELRQIQKRVSTLQLKAEVYTTFGSWHEQLQQDRIFSQWRSKPSTQADDSADTIICALKSGDLYILLRGSIESHLLYAKLSIKLCLVQENNSRADARSEPGSFLTLCSIVLFSFCIYPEAEHNGQPLRHLEASDFGDRLWLSSGSLQHQSFRIVDSFGHYEWPSPHQLYHNIMLLFVSSLDFAADIDTTCDETAHHDVEYDHVWFARLAKKPDAAIRIRTFTRLLCDLINERAIARDWRPSTSKCGPVCINSVVTPCCHCSPEQVEERDLWKNVDAYSLREYSEHEFHGIDNHNRIPVYHWPTYMIWTPKNALFVAVVMDAFVGLHQDFTPQQI